MSTRKSTSRKSFNISSTANLRRQESPFSHFPYLPLILYVHTIQTNHPLTIIHTRSFPGLPDDEEARLDSGFLVLTATEVKDIFEPVVKEVCDLVQGQVDGLRSKSGVVSGIVLVGGFGQSDYLYRRLKAHFTSAEPPPPYTEMPTHAVVAGNGSIEVMQVSELASPSRPPTPPTFSFSFFIYIWNTRLKASRVRNVSI